MFVIVSYSADGGDKPVGVASTREVAEHMARQFEEAYRESKPAYDKWCKDRSELAHLGQDEAALATIRETIGEQPHLAGYRTCNVVKVFDFSGHANSPSIIRRIKAIVEEYESGPERFRD